MFIVNIIGFNYQFLISVPGLKLTVCFHLSVIFFGKPYTILIRIVKDSQGQ